MMSVCQTIALFLAPAIIASAGLPRAASADDYRTIVLADRPIAYYRFEESHDTAGEETQRAKDDSGNSHDGFYRGAVALQEPSATPALGRAIALGGKLSRVHIPRHEDFKFGLEDLTFECWFNCRETILSRGDLLSCKAEGKDFAIFKPCGNANLLAFAKPGRAFQAQTDPLSLNAWHHCVYVRREGIDSFYIDGQLSGTSTGHALAIDMNADILIGANHHGSSDSIDEYCLWNGCVDEVAFYRCALDAPQILRHYRVAMLGNADQSATAASPLLQSP